MGTFNDAFPEVNPLAKALIDNLFYEKILLANELKASLAKSLDIKRLQGEIMAFVLQNSNANFLLQTVTTKGEIEVGIRFGNYEELTDATKDFVITVDPTISTFRVEQILHGRTKEIIEFKEL